MGDEMFKTGVKGNDRRTRETKGRIGQRWEWSGMEGKRIGQECKIFLLLFMSVIVQYVAVFFAHLSFNGMFYVIRPFFLFIPFNWLLFFLFFIDIYVLLSILCVL